MNRVAALDGRLLSAGAGGDSTYWRGLLHGLARTDSDWRFLIFVNAADATTIPNDPRFSLVPVRAWSGRWWSMVAFPLKARRAGARVIHTQYNLSPLAGARGVTLVHDVSFFIGPEWFQPKDRWLLRCFVPASVRRARLVLTVSETSRVEIERHIVHARGKTRVTPLALNPALKAVPRDKAARIVRQRLGIDAPYLLSVSTRWPRKNVALAIDAARLLPSDLPHRLVLTGRVGWGESGKSHPRVVETGYVDDDLLGPLYSAADLYLCPSLHEGFGLPLLEAFACQCPVLCSDRGALPEVAAGAACVEGDLRPEVWATRVRELLADSSKVSAMRKRGVERVGDYDWRETARRTLEAYCEVAS